MASASRWDHGCFLSLVHSVDSQALKQKMDRMDTQCLTFLALCLSDIVCLLFLPVLYSSNTIYLVIGLTWLHPTQLVRQVTNILPDLRPGSVALALHITENLTCRINYIQLLFSHYHESVPPAYIYIVASIDHEFQDCQGTNRSLRLTSHKRSQVSWGCKVTFWSWQTQELICLYMNLCKR